MILGPTITCAYAENLLRNLCDRYEGEADPGVSERILAFDELRTMVLYHCVLSYITGLPKAGWSSPISKGYGKRQFNAR